MQVESNRRIILKLVCFVVLSMTNVFMHASSTESLCVQVRDGIKRDLINLKKISNFTHYLFCREGKSFNVANNAQLKKNLQELITVSKEMESVVFEFAATAEPILNRLDKKRKRNE